MKTDIRFTPNLFQRIRSAFRVKTVRNVLVLFIFLCGGCQSPRVVVAPATPAVISERLVPGDVVRVSFTGARQHDITQKIRPDGGISLPLLGEVPAAGRSVTNLQSDLRRKSKEQLQDDEVIVTVDSNAAVVYVTGAVNKPGKVTLDRPMTAFEAIMEAGGFDPGLANLRKVILVRNQNGRQFTQTLDLSSAIREHSSTPFFLKPYDVIYVKEKFF